MLPFCICGSAFHELFEVQCYHKAHVDYVKRSETYRELRTRHTYAEGQQVSKRIRAEVQQVLIGHISLAADTHEQYSSLIKTFDSPMKFIFFELLYELQFFL